MATSTYVLKPRPAVRAFGLAAVTALAGSGLIVSAAQLSWPVAVSATGAVLLVLAVALVALALMAPARRAVTVELDDDGYRVIDAEGVQTGLWSEITKVTAAAGRLTFHSGADKRYHLMAPDLASDLDDIAADVAQRLDTNRGYRPFV